MIDPLAQARPLDLPGDPDAGALLVGAGDRGPVLVAHGGGNDRAFGLGYLIDRLTSAGYQVLLANLAGHGQGGTDTFTLQAARDRLDRLLDAAASLGLSDGPVLLGQSLGGALALDALARGLAPARLITVSAPHALATAGPVWAELAALFKPSIYRALRYATPYRSLPAFGPFRRQDFPVRLPAGQLDYLAAFRQAVADMSLLTKLPGTATPGQRILILHGQEDAVVPATQATELAQAIGPAADHTRFPGLHHLDPLFHKPLLDRLIAWL